MKIVITAENNSKDSNVDPRFGRAPFFAIYETDDESISFISNDQNLNASSGAGIQSAQNVAKLGAKVLLTGNCGPKAFSVLNSAGIKVAIGIKGTILQAIEKYKKGEREFASNANVDGHW